MKYYFYKICCEDLPDYVYVGSTKAFANRKWSHKGSCNNENNRSYNLKVYKTIRDNGGWDNWRMVCIAEEECETKRQAEMVEERYRQELNANMNGKRCYTSQEQRKEDNKEYNKEHKDEINEKRRVNYKEHKEHKEKKKEYYEEHKDEIQKRKSKKYTCACGSEIQLGDKSKHEKTKKHQEFLKTQS